MAVLDRFRLDDRVVVVSGASSGLGAEFAVALADAGAELILAARRPDGLRQTAERVRQLGRRAVEVVADVSAPGDCKTIIESGVEAFGRVDVLVNNAGVGTAVPALKETPEQFRHVLDVNLMGTYWLAQEAARVMEPGSSIINISSILGFTSAGLPQAAYSASKAAVTGLTRDLAQQWAGRKGIRVNAIAPGYLLSEMTSVYDEAALDALRARTVLGRLGEPDEVATALIWLASDAGSYMCGQTIIVDGGFTIT